MSDLDFYAHVATRGDVLGAGIGTTPAEWEARLGPDYLDDRSHGLMRRDYGLLELSFREDKDAWLCFGISVQVHRLIHDTAAVPPALQEAYGPFAPRVGFDDLSGLIRSKGHSVERDDDTTTTDTLRYRVPESGVRIFVIADPDPYGYGDVDPDDPTQHQVGDVRSINVAPDWWSRAT
ncbi:hypothetical protein [Streptomyces sp. CB03238]|uniref:hypothetical protein n=1 Tax=Streptomyces sp. CB03238 TaxID=1907777 RepID=UPI000A11424F|nr:hypothetical protein [Streptomyces sp. CB03238]ORT54576.1 hypothetical protein BKD26_35125 [Streptomyces sp. CB03238]